MSAALCLLVALAGAPDDPAVAQAKRLFGAGARAYKKEQYRVAIVAFDEAYKLAPRPAVIFSAAQAHRMQFFVDGDPRRLQRAIGLFEQYLEKVARGGRRHHAARHLAVLRPIFEKLELEAPPPPEAPAVGILVTSSVDTATATLKGAEPTAVPALFEVSPGTYELELRADGYKTTTLSVAALQGRVVTTFVELPELPALLSVAGAGGATIEVDGIPRGRVDEGRLFRLARGPHRVVVLANGRRPFVQDLDVSRGENLSLTPTLDVSFQRQASYALLSTSAVLLLAASVAGVVALEREGRAQSILDLQAERGWSTIDQSDYDRARSARDTAAGASVGFALGAAVTGLAGGGLFFFDAPLAPAPTIQVTGRF